MGAKAWWRNVGFPTKFTKLAASLVSKYHKRSRTGISNCHITTSQRLIFHPTVFMSYKRPVTKAEREGSFFLIRFKLVGAGVDGHDLESAHGTSRQSMSGASFDSRGKYPLFSSWLI